MSDLIANPVIQAAAIPFFCSLLLAGLMALSGIGQGRLAWLAVLAGFLSAYVIIFDFPPLLPKSSGQKIFYVAVLGAVVGLYLDRVKAGTVRLFATGLTLALLVIFWIGWRKIAAAPSLDHLYLVMLVLGFSVAFVATEKSQKDGTDEAIPLLLISIALGGVAVLSASASIGQNGGALAAALGGVLILNWPKRRFFPNAAMRMMFYTTLLGLLCQLVLFTKAPVWTLVIILPAFFAGRIYDFRFPQDRPLSGSTPPAFRSAFIGVFAALLAAAAIGLTLVFLPPANPYSS